MKTKRISQLRNEITFETIMNYLGINPDEDLQYQTDIIDCELEKILNTNYHVRSLDLENDCLYSTAIKNMCKLVLFYGRVNEDVNEKALLSSIDPLGYLDSDFEKDSDIRPLEGYLGYQYKIHYHFNDLNNVEFIEYPAKKEDYVINGLYYQKRKQYDEAFKAYKKVEASFAIENLDYLERTNFCKPEYLNSKDLRYYLVFYSEDSAANLKIGLEYYYGNNRELNQELGKTYILHAAQLGNEEAEKVLKEINQTNN